MGVASRKAIACNLTGVLNAGSIHSSTDGVTRSPTLDSHARRPSAAIGKSALRMTECLVASKLLQSYSVSPFPLCSIKLLIGLQHPAFHLNCG